MKKQQPVISRVRNRLKSEWSKAKNGLEKFYRGLYKDQHQLTSTTAERRYPELFGEVQQAWRDRRPASILSFGCSTGEECLSLHEYFPFAEIIGADINKSNLRSAQARYARPGIRFIHSSPRMIEQHGPYDIIFCLSVLCRWEDTRDLANCEAIYPFAKYEEVVERLSASLSENGLLIIYNSNFRFEESDAFRAFGFEIVPTPSVADSGFVHKFDRNNNRSFENHTSCVYRKMRERKK